MTLEAVSLAGLELGDGEALSVSFVGPRTMRRVNREFLGHDYLTDVICFDYRPLDGVGDDGAVAVEILVSPDMALENAERFGRSYESELMLYVAHGVLHAAGYDDSTPDERRRMRRAERAVMEKIYRP